MALGEKLWEGKGKSVGAGSIKSVSMEGVTMEYSFSVQLKGMGRAKGADIMLNATATSTNPPKGVAVAKDIGVFNTMSGDMGTMKGYDLMKMARGSNPSSVGLYTFMTMSEKLGWMNELIALVTFEALDQMWQEMKVTIWEWK